MPARFDIAKTSLADLALLQRRPIGDERGYLERLFCVEELAPVFGQRGIEQINRTVTATRGVVRGLHFQRPPHAEMKLVACLRGQVFDVAVDLRRGSPTFLKWHGEILSEDNHRTLLIPEGFAHGFQTLTPDCEMIYFHTAAYHPEVEGSLNARDPRLAIAWPEPVTDQSPRDKMSPMLTPDFDGVAT